MNIHDVYGQNQWRVNFVVNWREITLKLGLDHHGQTRTFHVIYYITVTIQYDYDTITI